MSALDNVVKVRIKNGICQSCLMGIFGNIGHAEDCEMVLAIKELDEMEDLIHTGKHAFELADHHTRSMAEPPLFSNIPKEFYKGIQHEAFFFRNLLRDFGEKYKSIFQEESETQ